MTSAYARRPRATGYMLAIKAMPCLLWRFEGMALWLVDRRPEKDRGRLVNIEQIAPYAAPMRVTPCCGAVEADHAGRRAVGRKALDSTVIPLCTQHHRERTDHTGAFKLLTRDQARAFCEDAIAYTQHLARARGLEIPNA